MQPSQPLLHLLRRLAARVLPTLLLRIPYERLIGNASQMGVVEKAILNARGSRNNIPGPV